MLACQHQTISMHTPHKDDLSQWRGHINSNARLVDLIKECEDACDEKVHGCPRNRGTRLHKLNHNPKHHGGIVPRGTMMK
jgi:hypothetical protein